MLWFSSHCFNRAFLFSNFPILVRFNRFRSSCFQWLSKSMILCSFISIMFFFAVISVCVRSMIFPFPFFFFSFFTFHSSLLFPFRFSNFLFSKLKSVQDLKRGAPSKLLDLCALGYCLISIGLCIFVAEGFKFHDFMI